MAKTAPNAKTRQVMVGSVNSPWGGVRSLRGSDRML